MEQSVSEVPKVFPEQIKHGSQNKAYEIEGTRIDVSWKEFSPMSREGKPLAEISQDEAILFLPGWSAKAATTINYLTQSFANDSGRTALSITTRPEKVVPDSLYQEAKAIRNLMAEKGLKKIILTAHSEGGIKAVDLIYILQKENPNIEIQGLILLDPVGLYEQGEMELARKFGLDTLISTPITLTKNLRKNPALWLKGLRVTTDIIFNMVGEMVKAKGIGYPAKLWSQIKEMAKANTRYADVKCPVVLIQGEQDPVSDHKRVIPIKDGPKSLSGRSKILKDIFFPNSPRVDMLVPKKIGHHGIPYFREKSISNASLGLLRRFWETQQSHAQPIAQPTAPASQGNILQN